MDNPPSEPADAPRLTASCSFDDHPLSYPFSFRPAATFSDLSATDNSTSSSASSSVQPPPSEHSSNTSLDTGFGAGTSWFDDRDDDDEYDQCCYDRHTKPLPAAPSPESPHDSVLFADCKADDIDEACQFERNDWFAQFDGELDISDDPPSRDALEEAGDIPVFDSAGNQRAFKSLYTVGDVVGSRQLIIFIRHFYCGACKAYIDALINTINAGAVADMPLPTSISIIGCGKPELIRHYKATTQCPFPIFADPSRRIFKLLGMRISFNVWGTKRPEYMRNLKTTAWMAGQLRDVRSVEPHKRYMGGNLLQIGGEFLFQDGEIAWCHRMRNYRGHAEMGVIKRILDVRR